MYIPPDSIPWGEAKKQRLIINPVMNLAPLDRMFDQGGYPYPTRCYTLQRKKSEGENRPILYDREYVLDFYQSRVIKELSLKNQLLLLEMIKNLYDSEDDTPVVPTAIGDYFDSLTDDSKLQLLRDLAKKIGMRVIKRVWSPSGK